MWSCYFGEISESYKERWEPHTVDAEKGHPDVFDVLVGGGRAFGYRLGSAAYECFSDRIQVDWGGWACKATKAQVIKYNRKTRQSDRIPEEIVNSMEDGKVYGILEVEMY